MQVPDHQARRGGRGPFMPPPCQAGSRTVRRSSPHPALSVAVFALLSSALSTGVSAQPRPQVMNGVPLLPVPAFDETGLPAFTMPVGATALDASTTTTGTTTTAGDGSAGGDAGTGSVGDGSDSTSMASLNSRSWGAAAAQNAETVGITPVALAATCQIEAGGCQTNPASGSTTITGSFQMLDSTYTAMMNAALARNPSLAANIVPGLAGKLDPATESIAAAEYLRQGAVALQSNQVTNPTVLDVRGYYNFGPGNAASIAQADDSALMSSQIKGLTDKQLLANGITSGVTTVGQWRASVTSKIGASAASAPVLLSRS